MPAMLCVGLAVLRPEQLLNAKLWLAASVAREVRRGQDPGEGALEFGDSAGATDAGFMVHSTA
jgi:hypothetical protein